ncbi:MAG: sigma-70 family RNA polymerase sigma factor [Verrucomicrobiota bacterium]
MHPKPVYNPETSMDFTELMVSHQTRLLAYIRSLVSNQDIAKDVLQQTNLVLLKKSKDFQLGSSFSAWARRVAYFEVLTQRRTMGRERILFDGDLLEKMASTAEAHSDQFEDRREALAECMRRLSQKQKTMLVERYVDQKGVARIAEESGTNANAISQQLFRIKTNLMKCVSRRLQSVKGGE